MIGRPQWSSPPHGDKRPSRQDPPSFRPVPRGFPTTVRPSASAWRARCPAPGRRGRHSSRRPGPQPKSRGHRAPPHDVEAPLLAEGGQGARRAPTKPRGRGLRERKPRHPVLDRVGEAAGAVGRSAGSRIAGRTSAPARRARSARASAGNRCRRRSAAPAPPRSRHARRPRPGASSLARAEPARTGPSPWPITTSCPPPERMVSAAWRLRSMPFWCTRRETMAKSGPRETARPNWRRHGFRVWRACPSSRRVRSV